MKTSRRTFLKGATAAGVLIPWLPIIKPKAAGVNAWYMDGWTKLYNTGPTPDTVEDQIDPGLPPVTTSTNQLISTWFNLSSTVGMDIHTLNGFSAPNAYATLVESQFIDAPWCNGLWVIVRNDPDPVNNHYVLQVVVSSDSNYTNWINAETEYGIIPPDDSWHNLQIYIDSLNGTVDYLFDGIQGTPGNEGFPAMTVNSNGPFFQPIEGMSWQVGCDTYEGENSTTYDSWETTWVGTLDELMVYSGNYKMLNTLVNNQLFYQVSGNLLRAKTFILGGQEIASEFPTIYLRGSPNDPTLLNANSEWFANANPQLVLPWITIGVPDPDSPGTGVLLPSADPYP